MTTNRQDELSLRMRIPADRCYLSNAILTLDGICDHFCFTEAFRDRTKKALETALKGSIDLSYQKATGLFDLQFSIYKDRLMISVEDFLLEEDCNDRLCNANCHQVKHMLEPIEELTDGMVFTEKKGRNACYSMEFDIAFMEENL